jgi:hypothetical protein
MFDFFFLSISKLRKEGRENKLKLENLFENTKIYKPFQNSRISSFEAWPVIFMLLKEPTITSK